MDDTSLGIMALSCAAIVKTGPPMTANSALLGIQFSRTRLGLSANHSSCWYADTVSYADKSYSSCVTEDIIHDYKFQ